MLPLRHPVDAWVLVQVLAQAAAEQKYPIGHRNFQILVQLSAMVLVLVSVAVLALL